MKNNGLLIFLVSSSVVLTSLSCSSEGFDLGLNYLDEELRMVIIDTCTVKMTTITIDSLVTSGKGSVMTGRYSDRFQGKTECTAYVPFKNPGSQSLPDMSICFDSLTLALNLNGKWHGDTTQHQTFNISKLTEVIELPDKEKFYSNWSVSHEEKPLCTFSINPRPLSQTTYSVRLPDELGADLLRVFTEDDQTVLGTDERFSDYFKGFAIMAGSDNSCILGFSVGDTSMTIRLHYHYSADKPVTGVIKIKAGSDMCFSGVTSNRDDTPFENPECKDLPSDESGNMVLVQALTASYVKIEFPYLNNLMELGNFGAILDATLKICPVRGSYSVSMPPPAELSLYVSDENNVSLSAITTYSGEELQNGNLVIDNLFNRDTYYSYDVTSFLKEQQGLFGVNRRSLQLIVPADDLASSLNTLVAGDGNNSENTTKLIINYLIYNE